MHLHLALLAAGVCVAAYGCATPEKDGATPVAAQTRPSLRYLTGSRLPLREEDTGAHNVMTAEKAAHEEAMQRMTSGSPCAALSCRGAGAN